MEGPRRRRAVGAIRAAAAAWSPEDDDDGAGGGEGCRRRRRRRRRRRGRRRRRRRPAAGPLPGLRTVCASPFARQRRLARGEPLGTPTRREGGGPGRVNPHRPRRAVLAPAITTYSHDSAFAREHGHQARARLRRVGVGHQRKPCAQLVARTLRRANSSSSPRRRPRRSRRSPPPPPAPPPRAPSPPPPASAAAAATAGPTAPPSVVVFILGSCRPCAPPGQARAVAVAEELWRCVAAEGRSAAPPHDFSCCCVVRLRLPRRRAAAAAAAERRRRRRRSAAACCCRTGSCGRVPPAAKRCTQCLAARR